MSSGLLVRSRPPATHPSPRLLRFISHQVLLGSRLARWGRLARPAPAYSSSRRTEHVERLPRPLARARPRPRPGPGSIVRPAGPKNALSESILHGAAVPDRPVDWHVQLPRPQGTERAARVCNWSYAVLQGPSPAYHLLDHSASGTSGLELGIFWIVRTVM